MVRVSQAFSHLSLNAFKKEKRQKETTEYMYNSYYPYQMNYNNQFQQQPSYNSLLQQNNTAGKQEVVRVNGKNGAQAFQLPPNSSILLLDETAPIVWLKTTDGAGYPTITPYDINPHQTETS